MTDEEILKAFQLCNTDTDCDTNGCPYNDMVEDCISMLNNDIISRFNELKAENAALRERLEKAVELPCKIGDRFYIVEYYPPEIIEEECCDFSFREFPKILLENGFDCTYELGDNGSYFVTFDKNEAKKIFEKLKKEQKND